MKLQSTARAQIMAQKAAAMTPFGGFDIGKLFELFMQWLPSIVKCFAPSDAVEAQKYVAKRWAASQADDKYGGYDKRLVKAATRNLLQTSRVRLTYDQAYAMSRVFLDDVRLGDTSQGSIVIVENLDFVLI